MIRRLIPVAALLAMMFGSWGAEASARSNLVCTEYLCVSYFKGARPQLQSLHVDARSIFEDPAEPEFPEDRTTMDLAFTNGLKLRLDMAPYENGRCTPELTFSADRREFIEVLCLHGVDGYQDSRIVVFGRSGGSALDLGFVRTIRIEQQLMPKGAVHLLQSTTTREAEVGSEGN